MKTYDEIALWNLVETIELNSFLISDCFPTARIGNYSLSRNEEQSLSLVNSCTQKSYCQAKLYNLCTWKFWKTGTVNKSSWSIFTIVHLAGVNGLALDCNKMCGLMVTARAQCLCVTRGWWLVSEESQEWSEGQHTAGTAGAFDGCVPPTTSMLFKREH